MSPGLVLFDLDGTLLRAGDRAHQEALLDAVRAVLGVEPTFDGVPLAGRLDGSIVHDLVAAHGLERAAVDALLAEVAATTTAGYAAAVARDGWRGAVLPGVVDLLDALDRDGWVSGVLTGNLEGVARARLAAAGLDTRLAFGAYGDAAVDRWELVELARRRIGGATGAPWPLHATVLVGDTPRDVEAAARAGARSLAVATGPVPRAELEAAGPDALVDDLADTGAVVELLVRLVRP